jgi:hypothetical protein
MEDSAVLLSAEEREEWKFQFRHIPCTSKISSGPMVDSSRYWCREVKILIGLNNIP